MLLRVRIRINISFLLFQVLLYRSQQETLIERFVTNWKPALASHTPIRQFFGLEFWKLSKINKLIAQRNNPVKGQSGRPDKIGLRVVPLDRLRKDLSSYKLFSKF
jgi:hypothetical protein